MTNRALFSLAYVAMKQGKLLEAMRYLEQALGQQPIEAYVVGRELEEVLYIYRTLAQMRDGRAFSVLDVVYQMIMKEADRFTDATERERYLNNVPARRELIAAWQARSKQIDEANQVAGEGAQTA